MRMMMMMMMMSKRRRESVCDVDDVDSGNDEVDVW